MQGKKQQQEQLFLAVQLSELVLEDNFYRVFKKGLEPQMQFLYKATESRTCGRTTGIRVLILWCSLNLFWWLTWRIFSATANWYRRARCVWIFCSFWDIIWARHCRFTVPPDSSVVSQRII